MLKAVARTPPGTLCPNRVATPAAARHPANRTTKRYWRGNAIQELMPPVVRVQRQERLGRRRAEPRRQRVEQIAKEPDEKADRHQADGNHRQRGCRDDDGAVTFDEPREVRP